MTRFKSDFLNVLHERGHVHQCTDLQSLDEKASKGVITGYIGFDATADSLHVGSLAVIMMLRRMQQTGHRPIALMGGGTTKIGDPSDKTGMRQMLTDEKINANIDSIKTIFSSFLNFGTGPKDALMANNADWLDGLQYIPFLREVGTHFTINRMVAFDFVKRRLEQELPLTFLEFNYMIMQGYDFVELNKRTGCTLQMGGSDQWGNIVNGLELGRRMKETELFGLTTPLIMTSSGVKMGKTVGGAVWLRADRLAPYDYWQFWRNTEDGDVVRFLKLFTDLPLAEIAKLEALKDAEINEAKKILAFEATKMLHGEAAAHAAAETARQTFEGSGKGANLPTLTLDNKEHRLLEVIVALKFAESNGAAKRLIEQGSVSINGAKVSEITAAISSKNVDADGQILLAVGKKNRGLISFK